MTNANTTNPDFPEYDWTEQHKSYILSSFYWGYVLTQFPGGYLSIRFGAKITILISTFASAICSLITPVCVGLGGWPIFCVIRLLQGLFQGVIFPAIHDHLAKWSPLQERNMLGVLSLSGADCGTVIALASSGLIASGQLGWPGISYISAAMCFVWCAFWLVFAADNAPSSKFISPQECKYIETSLERSEDFHQQKIPVPWRAIFTSVPFLAFLVVRCAEAWGFTTIQAQIPSYMNGVLNMEIKKNGLFSALPYLTMWLSLYAYLALANFLTKRNIMSLTAMRKTINTISLWIPALLLIGIGFLGSNQATLAIVLMTLNVGINGGSTIGCSLNSIDLAPNHVAILMGISNTIVNIMLILSPLLVGVIVTNKHSRSQWQIVFAIAALIFFLGNLFYILLGTSETQSWNAINFENEKDLEKSARKQVTEKEGGKIEKKVQKVEAVEGDKIVETDFENEKDLEKSARKQVTEKEGGKIEIKVQKVEAVEDDKIVETDFENEKDLEKSARKQVTEKEGGKIEIKVQKVEAVEDDKIVETDFENEKDLEKSARKQVTEKEGGKIEKKVQKEEAVEGHNIVEGTRL